MKLDPTELPRAGQNNLWFHHNDSNRVIVFLHGFLSDSRSCWLHEGTSKLDQVYWPSLVRDDKRLGDPSIYLAGFYTAVDAGPFNIRNCAEDVFRALGRIDPNGVPAAMAKDSIVFVCHSAGGIVARYLLLEYERHFIDKSIGLVLIASPSFGSKWANRLRWLATLYNQTLGLQLQWGSSDLRDLNARFKNFVDERRLPSLRGVEAYENHFILHRWFVPDRSRVVTEESAGIFFGAPSLLRKTNHYTSVKPESLHHPSHELLVDFCTTKMVSAPSTPSESPHVAQSSHPPPVESIQLGNLRPPVDQDLFVGRQGSVKQLGECWGLGSVKAVQIVADGGMGKSTLVWQWLRDIRAREADHIPQALDWSFYNQGEHQHDTSSYRFFREAIQHFAALGLIEADLGSRRPEHIGRQLAKALLTHGGVLVLDGLEPLQYAPNDREGALKDEGLQAFFEQLFSRSTDGSGPRCLVVVTTRWRLPRWPPSVARQIDLNPLTPDDGAKLLASFRLADYPERSLHFEPAKSLQAELAKTSSDFGGHPLSLLLLASFLLFHEDGNLARRDAVPALADGGPDTELYRHAQRILRSYNRVFADQGHQGTTSSLRQVLRVLALFDRPVSVDLLRCLWMPSGITGITEGMSDDVFQRAVDRLVAMRILSAQDSSLFGTITVHPVIRQFFRDDLYQEEPDAARCGHDRVFKTLQQLVPASQGYAQLDAGVHAIMHGCKAARYRDAYKLYETVILGGGESRRTLTPGLQLAALSHFFQIPWSSLATPTGDSPGELSVEAQLHVLRDAGYCLQLTRGYSDADAEAAFRRGAELAGTLSAGTNAQFLAYYGLYRLHLMRGELKICHKIRLQLEDLAGKPCAPAIFRVAELQADATNSFFSGKFATARASAAQGVSNAPHRPEDLDAQALIFHPVVGCLNYVALSSWHLGDVDSAVDTSLQAIQLSDDLGHQHSVAVSRYFHTFIHQFRRDFQKTKTAAEELIRFCSERGFELWPIGGRVMLGWATAAEGARIGDDRPIEEGHQLIVEALGKWYRKGAGIVVPYWKAMLAEVCGLLGDADAGLRHAEEAVALAEVHEERWWDAELWRIQGDLLWRSGREEDAETAFAKAVQIAQSQGSVSLELRCITATLQHNLPTRLGREQTIRRLQCITERFVEGRTSSDLQMALTFIS